MVNNNNFIGPKWPDVNDTSNETFNFISRLSENHKVQVAVQRIKAGNALAFTTGDMFNPSPFSWKLKDRVVTELENEGHKVDVQERRDEGGGLYAMDTTGWLDAYIVSIKDIKR